MPGITHKGALPDHALMPVKLVEKLGFTDWTFHYDYDTPADVHRRVQIRDDGHYAPTTEITKLGDALKRGDDLPPIILTRDGYLIDGNTRVMAAQKIRFPKINAVVINDNYAGGTDGTRTLFHLLGAAFNTRNGRGIDRHEIRKAVIAVGKDGGYDATRIAALLGASERYVQNVLVEERARTRAAQIGHEISDTVPSSLLQKLGGASAKLNDAPYLELTRLTQDTGLTNDELRELIQRVVGAGSDNAALAVLAQERATRREQIREHTAGRKTKPPLAAQLRQRLGFILEYNADPNRLVEHSPNFTAQHLDALRASITTLQAVVAAQEAGFLAEQEPTVATT